MRRWKPPFVVALFCSSLALGSPVHFKSSWQEAFFGFAFSSDSLPDGGLTLWTFLSGGSGSSLAQFRFLSDGSPDTTFGKDGYSEFQVPFGQFSAILQTVPLADGRFLHVGSSYSSDQDVLIFRAHANGDIDPTYGTKGFVVLDVNLGTNDIVERARLQSDGKLLLTGMATTDLGSKFFMARLEADGNLDASFGSGGYLLLDKDGVRLVQDATDGLFLAIPDADKLAIVRVTEDGTVDSTFGENGKLTPEKLDITDSIQAVARDSKGRFLVAGSKVVDGDADILIKRYFADGHIDDSFADKGEFLADGAMGSEDRLMLLHVYPKDDILVCSEMALPGRASELNAYRLDDTGNVDVSFGEDGYIKGTPIVREPDQGFGSNQYRVSQGKLITWSTDSQRVFDPVTGNRVRFHVFRYGEDGR